MSEQETLTEQTADKNYVQYKFTQEEVGYIDYAVRRNPVNSVCQTCRFFIGHDHEYGGMSNCRIVECYPLDIVGTGYCDKWTPRKIVEPEPLEVIIVEGNSDDDSEEYAVGIMSRYGVSIAPAVIDTVEKRGLFSRDKVETSFKVLPSGHWIACYTNNFLDDDNEILKAKAHKDYVKRIKAGLTEMPDLWLAHIEGTSHGKAQLVDYIETDGVITVFAVGTFEDSKAGKSARRYYEKAKPGEISLSHGFVFPTWAKKNGEYEVYNTFEISTLRRGQEANAFTNFSTEIKDRDKTMPLQEAQIEHIKTVFGDAAPEIIKRVEAKGKADKSLADLGAKYKGFTDFADVDGETTTNKGQDTATIEAFKALIPTLFEDSLTQTGLLEAMDKRLDAAEKAKNDALEAKFTALETEVKGLRVLLNMPGQAASEAASTVVKEVGKPLLDPDLEKKYAEALDAIQQKQTGQGDQSAAFWGYEKRG